MLVVVCLIGNDIRPFTELEVLFTTGLLLLGVMVIALFIGSLTSIVADADYLANKKKEQIQSVMSYMKYRQVPRPLQSKIVSYLNYLWTSAQSTYHQNLVGDLPDTLALQLNLVLKRRLIECVPMFAMISPHAMIGIVHRLESIIALPNQVLTHQGDNGDRMYFICRGLLTASKEDNSGSHELVNNFSAGDFFGESAMLNDHDLRPTTVVSKTFSELEMLGVDDFHELSEEHVEIRHLMEAHSKEKLRKTERKLANVVIIGLKMKKYARLAKLKVQQRNDDAQKGAESADADGPKSAESEASSNEKTLALRQSIGLAMKLKRRARIAKENVAKRRVSTVQQESKDVGVVEAAAHESMNNNSLTGTALVSRMKRRLSMGGNRDSVNGKKQESAFLAAMEASTGFAPTGNTSPERRLQRRQSSSNFDTGPSSSRLQQRGSSSNMMDNGPPAYPRLRRASTQAPSASFLLEDEPAS
jgi:CRP-like cAMP-binding protein